MSKVIIFSYENDIDRIGCVVLAKLAFEQVDYVLLEDLEALEVTFRKYIELNSLNDYEKIFITDLSLCGTTLKLIENCDLKDKIYVFKTQQGTREDNISVTDLFYKYLIKNNLIIRTPAINTFVEYTRLEYTGEWQTSQDGIKAHNLSILLDVLAADEYIKIITKKLRGNSYFNYSDEDLKLIEEKKNN